ncbi:MAG: hypothetical protein H7A25_09275 [Leptospiraceae bacterium]|nr:hypothetical protein [Leptospiraceae bacterium]MCP5500080.1 hypothetical protein [Leptospiraceae bacterium]
MKKSLKFISTLFLLFLFALNVSAKEYKDDKARIKLSVPNNWKVSGDEDNLEIYSPDESIFIMFHVSKKGNIDATRSEVNTILNKVLKNKKTTKSSKVTVNGMKAIEEEGTGVTEGTPVEWSVAILQAKRPVMVISLLGPGWKKWESALNGIANSLKRY